MRGFLNLSVLVMLCMMLGCNQNCHCHRPPHENTDYSQAIAIDTANMMIESYLNSINYQNNDSDLHCLIISADSLRDYLNDKKEIKYMKLVFAHTLDYIRSGHANQNCGYKINALTLVMVGFDAKGNYVYNNCGMVYDHATPCPAHCPPRGTAQNNVLVPLNTHGGDHSN